MVSWSDLTGQEKVAMVGAALSIGQKREVNAYIWEDDTANYPYTRLQALQLITLVQRKRMSIVYTISPQAVTLLLSAPDDADGQTIFPTSNDIREMKDHLRHKRSGRTNAQNVAAY